MISQQSCQVTIIACFDLPGLSLSAWQQKGDGMDI